MAAADDVAPMSMQAQTALADQLAGLHIHEPAGRVLAQAGPHTGLLRQPTLPLEVIERVVGQLHAGAIAGDPATQLTLVRLSCVSRLVRHWALEALYAILVLPRHVREFRKWYARSVKSLPMHPYAGYTRAVFCAMDDVSNLTSFSAGWDHELLRFLHYCGPTLTHLSLWRSESMALLRDPGQIREGFRFGTAKPIHVWGEQDQEDEVEEEEEEGPPVAVDADDLFSREEMDDMPGWLKAEIRAQGTRAVTLRHKAHLTPTRRIIRRLQGCQPTHLSLMMSLPLLEHEDPALFSRMSIWYRVQELDVHISTPAQTPHILRLLASLDASPIRRLRISTSFISLCILTPPFPTSKRWPEAASAPESTQAPNICRSLAKCLDDPLVRKLLVDEFQGHHYDSLPNLERLILQRCIATATPAPTCVDSSHLPPAALADPAALQHILRVSLTRGNQAVWGKLKDRLSDFRQRAEGLSDGAWHILA